MKKIFFTCVLAILLSSSATIVAVSQNLNNPAKDILPSVPAADSFSSQLSLIKNSNIVYLNEIPSKAIRHFNKTHKNVDSVIWSKITDGNGGFSARFVGDEIATSFRYDRRGNYECCLRDYFEDRLPQEIRHRVKSIYYDFTIFFIKEVIIDDITVYIITLEDKTSWKNILVTEDEIIVRKEFSKTSQSSYGN